MAIHIHDRQLLEDLLAKLNGLKLNKWRPHHEKTFHGQFMWYSTTYSSTIGNLCVELIESNSHHILEYILRVFNENGYIGEFGGYNHHDESVKELYDKISVKFDDLERKLEKQKEKSEKQRELNKQNEAEETLSGLLYH